MRRRAYGGTRVNHVNVAKLLHGKESVGVTVGIDVGKHKLLAVCRWDDGTFERPWRIHNPSELPDLVKLLQHVGGDRKLVVAMESSGTYGDALRQALADAGLELQRVGTKAAHDYAEVFDGVPSQHGTRLMPCPGPMPSPGTTAIGWDRSVRPGARTSGAAAGRDGAAAPRYHAVPRATRPAVPGPCA